MSLKRYKRPEFAEAFRLNRSLFIFLNATDENGIWTWLANSTFSVDSLYSLRISLSLRTLHLLIWDNLFYNWISNCFLCRHENFSLSILKCLRYLYEKVFFVDIKMFVGIKMCILSISKFLLCRCENFYFVCIKIFILSILKCLFCLYWNVFLVYLNRFSLHPV